MPDDTWDNGILALPEPRANHTAVWVGDLNLMVVWGGYYYDGESHYLDTGGSYDPTTDTWVPTSLLDAPSARYEHSAVSTGSEMVVWGGSSGPGGRYDPVTDQWTPVSDLNEPSGTYGHAAVWTGSLMVVWGGAGGGIHGTGGRYDPEDDSWVPTSTLDAPSSRYKHTAVWTGREMLVWGGDHWDRSLAGGGRYAHGSLVDDDADGQSECDGDCNDGHPHVYREAVEINDGLDNQCPGDPGHGIIDEISGNSGFHNSSDKNKYSWQTQVGTVLYEVVRSGKPDFSIGCTFLTTAGTAIHTEDPSAGRAYFYLNRPIAPHQGSWGRDSSGQERIPVCSNEIAAINFQPPASDLPEGFTMDWGQPFDPGIGHGWDVSLAGNTRDRELLENQLLDTFIYTSVLHRWDKTVPDDVYVVRVTSGGAAYGQGPQQMAVEDLTVVSGETTAMGSFLVTAACVRVTDGQLTIEIGGLAGNTILNSVRVELDSCTHGTILEQETVTP